MKVEFKLYPAAGVIMDLRNDTLQHVSHKGPQSNPSSPLLELD